jgi:hypothetical protein
MKKRSLWVRSVLLLVLAASGIVAACSSAGKNETPAGVVKVLDESVALPAPRIHSHDASVTTTDEGVRSDATVSTAPSPMPQNAENAGGEGANPDLCSICGGPFGRDCCSGSGGSCAIATPEGKGARSVRSASRGAR